ncbi:hypothetical protein Cgig2_021202 [Carnegiea gigantea]|uniref:Cytochrome P450 n=1 Tax=Carnegiea gigantea TaxID=171969 RepID=A0A9Q1KX74_9CARY|nr:hypothetical protein Cgig2_021202 [Carnegiea gigantea]
MELLLISLFLIIIILVLRLGHAILWVPWRVQHHFKRQGISGPPYRPIFGNTAEIRRMYAEVQSKPVPRATGDHYNDNDNYNYPLNHGITYRVMPFYQKWSSQYGKTFLCWFGPKPMLAIVDPEMIKEVLMNTSGAFGKLKYNPSAKLLFGGGLAGLEGEKWVVHRHIANQAFNMERVKSWIPDIVASTKNTLTKWEELRQGREEFEVEINMILNETLRLYPPSVMMKRRTTRDILLRNLNIPAETQLYLAMAAVHRDVELWGEDADTFNPLRFALPRKHLASFFPFSLGPRVCVGQNLAILESRIILAMIIQQYTLTLSPTYVHAPMQVMTLQPQHGAHVIFRKI